LLLPLSIFCLLLLLPSPAAENASRGGAFGFKLDTLKKLSTVKDGKDGKTTLLDFLARAALDEGKVRGLGRLASDLAPVAAARLESLEALQTDVKAIERGLAQSSTQVDLCKRAAEASGGATNSEGDRFEVRPTGAGVGCSVCGQPGRPGATASRRGGGLVVWRQAEGVRGGRVVCVGKAACQLRVQGCGSSAPATAGRPV
jgi:hypothetical protein